jgi:hypothetical protein
VEGDTFEAFCRSVADAAADLLEGDGAGEVHIESLRTPPSALALLREGLRQGGP